MAEGGRPWWKLSAVERTPSSSDARPSGGTKECIQPKVPITPPKPVVVKQEPTERRPSIPMFSPGAHCPPYSPNGKPVDCSRVKLEPFTNVKTEPLTYIEQALVKGEFPHHFNWPVTKWEPVDGVPGTETASIKGDSKHYFPNFKQSVFRRLGKMGPRDRNRPPPNWKYIYSRQSYEPTESARAWWNDDVERVLKKRREAYLLTKLRDGAPIEARMERLWSFEVAKDDARRVIAESKWRANLGPGGLNGVNVGASCSSQQNPYLNNNLSSTAIMNVGLPLSERLGHLATIGGDSSVKRNFELPRKDGLSSVSADEVEILPVDKENIEVLTIDDEIEDALSNSEDEDDIKIISESDSDVIFIQKKQGEVTIIAQIEGRLVKMNRKRKLCVTFHNNGKRQCTLSVDTDLSNTSDKESQDGDISIIGETVSDVGVSSILQNKSALSISRLSDSEKNPKGEVEMEDDNNKEVENDGQDEKFDGSVGQDQNIDAVANRDEDGSLAEEEVSELLVDLPDGEKTWNGNESLNSSLNVSKKQPRNDTTVTSLDEYDFEIACLDENDVEIASQDETDVEIANQIETDVEIASQDETVVVTVDDGPLAGKYKATVNSVLPTSDLIAENEEQKDVVVDDGSEDEVIVLNIDNQVGERTVSAKEVDDIMVVESSSDDDSSIQEATVSGKDCGENGLNVKSCDVNDGKNATGESLEIDIEDEDGSVQEKAHVSRDFRDEKSESGFSEEIGTESGQDIKVDALIYDDLLERSPVTTQDSICASTQKTLQSAGDGEEIEIIETDHAAKNKKGDSLLHHAGTSSTHETTVKVPRRLTRQSILAFKRSYVDIQGPEPTSVPNVNVGSPRMRGMRRRAELLQNDIKSQLPTYTIFTRSKRS